MKHTFEDQRVFQEIILQLESSVVITDLQGKILFVNPFFEKSTGYTLEEIQGKNPRVLKSGHHSPELYKKLWNTILGGKTWEGELKNKRKDGSFFWEKVSISPMKDECGEMAYFISVKLDITKEKIEEEITTRRESLLNEIQELSLTGGWEFDIESGKSYWTEQLYHIHEIRKGSTNDFVRESLDKYHPDDREKIKSSYKQLLRDGTEFDLTARFIPEKGRLKWIRTKTRAVKDSRGTVKKIIGSLRDVTDTVLIQNKLHQSEQTYRVLFEQSSDPKLIERRGKFVDCNAAVMNALGYSTEEELIQKTVDDLSPYIQPNGFISENFWQAINNTLQADGNYKCEWNFLNKEGKEVPFEIMITRIESDEVEAFNYVVLRDISKRKLIEKDLRDAYEERGVLLSEIHHRVKNNLAVISGLIQLQLMNARSPELYQILNKSVNRINSIALIHEQLYQSDNFSVVSLAENIRKQLTNVQRMFSDQSDTDISTELNLEDVTVGITQALPVGLLINEIITNSLKYAFKGRSNGSIIVKLFEQNGYIHLNIGDDGHGVDGKLFGNGNTLGQKLIESLLAQLEAEYSIDHENGLMYHIRFPREESLSFSLN